MAVFSRLLFSQLKAMMFAWVTITLFFLVSITFLPVKKMSQEGLSDIITLLVSVGVVLALFLPKQLFYQQRYFSVLKITSRNVRNLWLFIVLQNLILLFLACSIGLFFSKLSNIDVLDGVSIWEKIAQLILILTLMIGIDGSQILDKFQRGSPKKHLLKQIVVVVIVFVFAFALFKVYANFSPLLALLGFCTLSVYGLFFHTDELVKMLPKRTKWIGALSSIVLLALLFAGLGVGDYRYSRVPNFLYSYKKMWSFEDIEKVKSIEEWILWQNRLESLQQLSVEQIIESYEKLNQYCPPKRRDNPYKIECDGMPGYTDFQASGKDARSEDQVLKLLDGSTEYAKTMGLLYARKIKKPFSRELILAIEKIAENESSIQGLARNTLTESYSEDYRQSMRISTDKSN